MRVLQPCSNPSNARPITRSWSRKAVRVRSSALSVIVEAHRVDQQVWADGFAMSQAQRDYQHQRTGETMPE
jgi:hypothetical protein